MATVSGGHKLDVGGLDLGGPWRTFSEAERQQMRKDDIEAGVTIALILTGVIVAGVVLMLIGVIFSLTF